jgi:aminoglycoside phosphotransferase (APT) family kinase protein
MVDRPKGSTVSAQLVDEERLGAWLDREGIEVAQPISIAPLSGGTSNAMFLVERGAGRWVLRRPAKVAIERANEGMRREYRILAALDGTNVPHPGVVALCEDHDVLGCTFFLMQHVEGVNPFPPPPALDDERHRAEIAFSMVDALARLHDVDWRSAGLGDLGRPDGFHERQVARWSRQLASYGGRELPGIDQVMAWLERNRPSGFEPSIMHGDFHMRNALIAVDPPGRVVAMLDWETATIGDPRFDLAGFCEVWCPVADDGWPARPALVERYRVARGLETIGDLTYYEVLYQFRIAILVEGIYQRSLRDPTRPDEHQMGERVLHSVARAVELTSGNAG